MSIHFLLIPVKTVNKYQYKNVSHSIYGAWYIDIFCNERLYHNMSDLEKKRTVSNNFLRAPIKVLPCYKNFIVFSIRSDLKKH